jgi:thiamine pyrophosphokinase
VKRRTVVLAAGFFPRAGSAARQALESARRVVCCDGAADAFKRRLGREPDVVVGDFDSVRGRFRTAECVRVAEQETNDLDKALALCRARGWTDPLVVGATGRREDHTLGNVFRALDAGVEVLTETGRFLPVRDRATLRVAPGTAVSVFAPDRRTRMTSRGLVWPLDDVRFGSLYCATLNRASAARVEVTTTHPVSVYVAF